MDRSRSSKPMPSTLDIQTNFRFLYSKQPIPSSFQTTGLRQDDSMVAELRQPLQYDPYVIDMGSPMLAVIITVPRANAFFSDGQSIVVEVLSCSRTTAEFFMTRH